MSGVCCVRVREWGRKEGKPRWVACALVVEREEWIRIDIYSAFLPPHKPLALFQPFLLREKSCGILRRIRYAKKCRYLVSVARIDAPGFAFWALFLFLERR